MTRDELFQVQGQIVVLERELEELELSGNNSLIILYNLLNPDRIDTSILDSEVNKGRVEFKHLNTT